MYEKVLIAEDMDDINKGVYSLLKELGIPEIQQVQYCDDAHLKLKKGVFDKDPFQLLITDLSFKSDHRNEKLASGEALVAQARAEFPKLKIIVYSVEDRLQRVRSLIANYKIDAYVCKSRTGLKSLAEAIKSTYTNQLYLSTEVSNALSRKSELEINDYDILLIKHLAKGLSQDEISHLFKQKDISPSSLSSIEKHLNRLRIQFKANNAIHLVAITKDLGLI
ncbi:response regulator [Muriicola sp. Z0-33]|uniref:response regulator n=1 Tax=Muriicola sp. Z0-33 TaxID=2816957 RepID=UPI0022389A6E|nr:response regulator [Muriicola sp. Z0-33]MCW5516917.1 response regulator transcription factor [Muriicola sp. Z0-33]